MAEVGTVIDRVFQGDCLSVLKKIPDNFVDLIVTSPPYADNRPKVPYDGVPVDKYVQWFLPISQELYRVLKPTGSFVLNIKERVINGERGTYVYELVMKMRGQGWLWIEEYIWCKKNTHPGYWRNRFRDLWEHCYHFAKSKHFQMFRDAVRVPIGEWAKKRLAKLGTNDFRRVPSATGSGFGRNVSNWLGKKYVYPGNVLHLPTESSNVGHPAAFPIGLPEWFIKLFTKEGDIVLDPFIGSGTTAVAAIKLKRHFIGIEISPKYYRVALERIQKYRVDVQQLEDVSHDFQLVSPLSQQIYGFPTMHSGRQKRD